jgi:hypothetical protein
LEFSNKELDSLEFFKIKLAALPSFSINFSINSGVSNKELDSLEFSKIELAAFASFK